MGFPSMRHNDRSPAVCRNRLNFPQDICGTVWVVSKVQFWYPKIISAVQELDPKISCQKRGAGIAAQVLEWTK